jgi:hypothetical protein
LGGTARARFLTSREDTFITFNGQRIAKRGTDKKTWVTLAQGWKVTPVGRGELQPGTRTLLTEIDTPNRDGALLPGIYCTIELQIPRKTPSLSVPADAIIFDRNGVQVAVASNGKAEIRKVGVRRDFGTRVEVDAGIKAGDQVILNPPVNLVDGAEVQPRTEATASSR